MARYKLVDPANPDKYEELVFISLNLRYWSKRWKNEYGYNNKIKMELYQDKMDKWHEDNTEIEGEIEFDKTQLGEKKRGGAYIK